MGDTRAISYQLFIQVSAPLRIPVGRLGVFDFPAGHYIYTGSAKRNLQARVLRHLARVKRLRWHIDYLLQGTGVGVTEVRLFRAPECTVNGTTPGCILVRGFGASDCRSACGSHLKHLGDCPQAAAMAESVG